MADIAAFFEEPRHRARTYVAAGLRRIMVHVRRVRDRRELTDARLDLNARQRADAGIPASRGFERTMASMIRGGIR